MNRSGSGRRWGLRIGIVVLVLLILDLALAKFLLHGDRLLGNPIAPFDPPIFVKQDEAIERLRERLASGAEEGFMFDAELGWCSQPESVVGQAAYDWAGARIGVEPLARMKALGTQRVVAVGCSMTHGDESPGPDTWCAVFDEALADVDVANLGVSAYGSDQALLRLRRDGLPLQPDEVWMGLLPGASFRVTTLYRPLLRHWSSSVAFKPRFVLEEAGRLRQLPNPAQRFSDTLELLGDQERFLEGLAEDSWVSRAPLAYAKRGSSLLHYSFVGRLALTYHEGMGREDSVAFADEETECYRLLGAIVQEARRASEEAGARFRILVLPGRADLDWLSEQGEAYWEDWCRELKEGGVDVVDLSSALMAGGNGLFMPNGHYSQTGNRIVAEELVRLWEEVVPD